MDLAYTKALERQFTIELVAEQRAALIDSDIAVDDRRHDVDLAVERFKIAVQQRDAIARRLQQLLDELSEAAA